MMLGAQLVAEEWAVPDVFVHSGASTLQDEVRDDAMEGEAIVVAITDQLENTGDGHRCPVRVEQQVKGAAAGRCRHPDANSHHATGRRQRTTRSLCNRAG